MHKAFLSGCLNEHVIDQSTGAVDKNDFDFLLEHDAEGWGNRFMRYDTAASLRNRHRLSRRDRKHHLVRPIQEKIIQVLNADKVFHSLSDDEVYKITVLNTATKKFGALKQVVNTHLIQLASQLIIRITLVAICIQEHLKKCYNLSKNYDHMIFFFKS